MSIQTKEITELYLSKMEEIHEFRGLTQFAYLQFNNAVANGFKVRTILGPTEKLLDQKQIKQKIKSYESGFLPKLSFQHAVSIFEAWFFDILRHLLRDKNRLNKKRKIEVSEVVSSGNIDELINKIIEAELNEIRYKKTVEWFEYLRSFVNINVPSAEQVLKISEIKASRDILVHNEGIANQIYLDKSGELARAKDGETLSFSHDYVFESWTALRNAMELVGTAVSQKVDT